MAGEVRKVVGRRNEEDLLHFFRKRSELKPPFGAKEPPSPADLHLLFLVQWLKETLVPTAQEPRKASQPVLVVFDRYGSYICFGSNNTNQLLVLQQKMQHFQGTNTLANVTSKNCQVQKPEALKVQEWALEPFAGGKIPRQIFRRHHFLYLPKLCSCQCSTALLLSHCSLPLRS